MNRFTSQSARRILTPIVLLALCVDCGGSGHGGSSLGTPVPGVPSTQSSPIALSVTGDYLVNVNPDAGTISVFLPGTMSKVAEVTVGSDPESVAIHKSNPTAYVANADGVKMRIAAKVAEMSFEIIFEFPAQAGALLFIPIEGLLQVSV